MEIFILIILVISAISSLIRCFVTLTDSSSTNKNLTDDDIKAIYHIISLICKVIAIAFIITIIIT